MDANSCVITDFHKLRPPFESAHDTTLDWLIHAHTKAESVKQGKDDHKFQKQMEALVDHVGCKSTEIRQRGHVIPDFLHHNWNEMVIYRLDDFPTGVGLQKRQEVHSEIVGKIFEKYYPDSHNCPSNILHVSCTGYVSPSPAQRIASIRNWLGSTTITHAYHMGCYASIPALRIGSGFVQLDGKRTDVVHTELCSLHINPLLHEPDQLVAQSLFADGFMKYSLNPEDSAAEGLKIISIAEEIIPNSLGAMAWSMTDWGFQFILAKEIPMLISQHIKPFVEKLCKQANIPIDEILEHALFAIHPGGPKIVEQAQKILQISDAQVKASKTILQKYGNMSSATLPHIWEAIYKDPTVPNKTKIVSLAFGPGLTIAGALLEKLGC